MASVSALAHLIAAPSFAPTGTRALDDRIDDAQDDVADDMCDGADAGRSTTDRYVQGRTGRVSPGAFGTSDTGDVSPGGRLRHGDGPWNHTFGVAYEFSGENHNKTKKPRLCHLRGEPLFHRSIP